MVAAGSVTVAYPFDTVRRRLMMMSGEKEKMYKVTYFQLTINELFSLVVTMQIWGWLF